MSGWFQLSVSSELSVIIILQSTDHYRQSQEWKDRKIKRFETTGQISLRSLTKIAMALDIADELRNIFTHVPYKDIRKVINEGR